MASEDGETLTDRPSSTATKPRTVAAKPKKAASTTSAAKTMPTGRRHTKADAAVEQAKFDHWFETPMFEPEPDEKWEELATSRRAPMRLAASALLRFDAATSMLRRARRDGAAEFDVLDLRETDLTGPDPEPAPRARAAAPARVARPRRETAPAADVEKFFLATAGGPPVTFEAPEEGFRARLNRVLDSWAAAEVAAEVKLERLMIPRRWRS